MIKENDFKNRALIKNEIIRLSNLLDLQFATELNFRNHCYLRIAYDNTVKNKWNSVIEKPFIKNASDAALDNVLFLLNKYLLDKKILVLHNKISLEFRKKRIE